MTIRSQLAVAVAVMACLQAVPLLAQSANAPEAASPASPAPAASTPAGAPAATSTDKTGTADGKSASEEPAKETGKPKSPKRIKVSAETRQQIDHALKTGTVPSRYRKQIPKEYQKYIPFER